MELADFILARVAEDETIARNAVAGSGKWASGQRPENPRFGVYDARGGAVAALSSDGYFAEHVAHHDPARVLAECDAKRRIVQMANGEIYKLANEIAPEWGSVADEDLLRLLTIPYADHPEYRQEWRP